jgi:hypothetical protein
MIAQTRVETIGRCLPPESGKFCTLFYNMRLADGGFGTQIVAQLHGGPRIGVLYASGNINQVIELADGDACIAKPYHTRELLTALRIVKQIVANGFAPPPFPPGFHLLAANKSPGWG